MAVKKPVPHETKFAMLLAWVLSPCFLTLLGFYLGTILGNRTHEVDLQSGDIHNGVQTAAVFFAGSIIAAIIATVVIPPVVERDYATREAGWAERADSEHKH